jgi:hypothetical protein
VRRYTAAEARALRGAATAGPWQRDGLDVLPSRIPSEGWLIAACGTSDSPDAAPYNAALIAAAPDLAATVEALEAELAEARLCLLAEAGDPAGAVGLRPFWQHSANGWTLRIDGRSVAQVRRVHPPGNLPDAPSFLTWATAVDGPRGPLDGYGSIRDAMRWVESQVLP